MIVMTIAVVVALALNDREATRYFDGAAGNILSARGRTIWALSRRVESDIKAALAVATLAVGLASLIQPHRLRT
jgi:hypothetical protein